MTALRRKVWVVAVCLIAVAAVCGVLYQWAPSKAKALMPAGPNLAPDCTPTDESPCYA